MMNNRKNVGWMGEETACRVLQQRGYRIIARNFRCRFGEIDIIAFHQGMLVFIEVRARTSLIAGFPEESINYYKRRRIRKVAEYYLMIHNKPDAPYRFDVVAILFTNEGQVQKIDIFPYAF